MAVFLFIISICILLFSFLVLFAAKQTQKWAKEDLALSDKAFAFLYGKDKEELHKKLEEIDDLIEEISGAETEISTDFTVVERARELLITALKEQTKNPA